MPKRLEGKVAVITGGTEGIGRPGEALAHAGTDFLIARDGRIVAVYLFFAKLP